MKRFIAKKKGEPEFGESCPPKVDDTRIKSFDGQFSPIS